MKKYQKEEGTRSKKIRKGDKVVVLSGNDRGQVGTVLEVQGRRALVQGINVRKKHMRGTQQNPKGSIINRECMVDSSNLCPCTKEETRVKLKVQTNKAGKHLVYKHEGKQTVFRTLQEGKKG